MLHFALDLLPSLEQNIFHPRVDFFSISVNIIIIFLISRVNFFFLIENIYFMLKLFIFVRRIFFFFFFHTPPCNLFSHQHEFFHHTIECFSLKKKRKKKKLIFYTKGKSCLKVSRLLAKENISITSSFPFPHQRWFRCN